MTRIIAMLPTYNEAENIGPLIDAILAHGPEYEALVVDDDSPDGTWQVVAERIRTGGEGGRVHLLHRTRDRGRGLAGIAGFREALRLGADYVIEMDADWSHDPRWIPSLVGRARRPDDPVDIVIGSRLVSGGGEAGRHPARGLITRAANTYIRGMLRLPVRDATSGYRVFSRRALAALPWDAMRATGPEVVQEVLLAAHARGFRMAEVPILFVERRHGQSTFNAGIMRRSLGAMVRLRYRPGELVPAPQDDRAVDGEQSADPAAQEPEAAFSRIPPLLAVPLSIGYRAGRIADRGLRISGLLSRRELPVPVICVGNLTVGGTGKTPMVRQIATTLQKLGYRPAVLSRGYGAEITPRRPLLVSDGERILAPPAETGDEPALLATLLPGVPVVIHASRYASGCLALKMFRNDVLILDDGFQHDRLERDLDVVLWDARDVPEQMHLLPAGRLREPLSALRRAGAVVITHADYLPEAERGPRLRELIRTIKRKAPGVALFEAETRIAGWHWLSGAPHSEEVTDGDFLRPGARVVAVSGIARPAGFEALLHQLGLEIAEHVRYPDHHPYTSEDVTRWGDLRQRTGAAAVVLTEKDAVKLEGKFLGRLPLAALQIELQPTEPTRWQDFLQAHLR